MKGKKMYIVTENKKILTPISVISHYVFKGIESILYECAKEKEFIEHIPSNAELIYDCNGDCRTLKFSKDVLVYSDYEIKRIGLFKNFTNKYDHDLIVLELESVDNGHQTSSLGNISYGYIDYSDDNDCYEFYNIKLDGDFDLRMLNKS